MRLPWFVVLVGTVLMLAILAPSAGASGPGPAVNCGITCDPGGGGGLTLCHDEGASFHLDWNSHWVIDGPVGWYRQLQVRLTDAWGLFNWHVERWVVTPPNHQFLAWQSQVYSGQQFHYWPNWWASPITQSSVYEYFKLVVDNTTTFQWEMAEYC